MKVYNLFISIGNFLQEKHNLFEYKKCKKSYYFGHSFQTVFCNYLYLKFAVPTHFHYNIQALQKVHLLFQHITPVAKSVLCLHKNFNLTSITFSLNYVLW